MEGRGAAVAPEAGKRAIASDCPSVLAAEDDGGLPGETAMSIE